MRLRELAGVQSLELHPPRFSVPCDLCCLQPGSRGAGSPLRPSAPGPPCSGAAQGQKPTAQAVGVSARGTSPGRAGLLSARHQDHCQWCRCMMAGVSDMWPPGFLQGFCHPHRAGNWPETQGWTAGAGAVIPVCLSTKSVLLPSTWLPLTSRLRGHCTRPRASSGPRPPSRGHDVLDAS